MKTIEIFEPALCGSTGLCGTGVPQELVTFSADLDWLRLQGGQAQRFNLASEPKAFTGQATVVEFLRVSGSGGLPLVLVDGSIAMSGRYPDRDQLAQWAAAEQPSDRSAELLTDMGTTSVQALSAGVGSFVDADGVRRAPARTGSYTGTASVLGAYAGRQPHAVGSYVRSER